MYPASGVRRDTMDINHQHRDFEPKPLNAYCIRGARS
jgi:hypothetical protein